MAELFPDPCACGPERHLNDDGAYEGPRPIRCLASAADIAYVHWQAAAGLELRMFMTQLLVCFELVWPTATRPIGNAVIGQEQRRVLLQPGAAGDSTERA